MNDDYSSSNDPGQNGRVSWLEKLGKAFSSEPQDRDELKAVLSEATERNIIDNDAYAMIEGALEVSEMQVRDVMVPRAQMVVIARDSSLDEFLPEVLESGHSRFPVIGEDRDEVEGILLAKDLLRFFASGEDEFQLSQHIRPAVVIPESKRLNVLLRDFRASRNHMAIVVDEYGGVAGLVTIEDVLEEIVGDIDDEHDTEEDAQIVKSPNGRYWVHALTPIEDFNAEFDCQLSDEEYDTIGGLVLAAFGRLPEEGEDVIVEDSFKFRVLQADHRRIHKLELST